MKFLIVATAVLAVAAALPGLRSGGYEEIGVGPEIVDIDGRIKPDLIIPPVIGGPALVEGQEPIIVGPPIIPGGQEPIIVGPGIVVPEGVVVGPAIIDGNEPISVGPAIVDSFEPAPVLVPETASAPLVQIILNINQDFAPAVAEPVMSLPAFIN